MQRTLNTFSILQATAAVVTAAVLLWSLGLSAINTVEAANVTTFSNTLSNSAPAEASDHTITFTTPTGITDDGSTIVLDFSDGPFVQGSVDETDLDISVEGTGQLDVAANCAGSEEIGADFSGWPTLTLTFCSLDGGTIAANGTSTIFIGNNASYSGDTGPGTDDQLTNPAAGSYQIGINIAAGTDTGETRVAIVDDVTVTASVDTEFTFTVLGVASGQTVNGTTTGGATSADTIEFGELDFNVASTAAQDLQVVTNARNGFTVSVVADGQLDSSTGADIDGFRNGTFDSSPQAWVGPSVSVGNENTYGHWGITSDDTDYFAANETYVSASTTPVEIFTHTGPADGTTTGEGTTRVGYTVQVSNLQEGAEDYEAVLTYIATPVF